MNVAVPRSSMRLLPWRLLALVLHLCAAAVLYWMPTSCLLAAMPEPGAHGDMSGYAKLYDDYTGYHEERMVATMTLISAELGSLVVGASLSWPAVGLLSTVLHFLGALGTLVMAFEGWHWRSTTSLITFFVVLPLAAEFPFACVWVYTVCVWLVTDFLPEAFGWLVACWKQIRPFEVQFTRNTRQRSGTFTGGGQGGAPERRRSQAGGGDGIGS